MRASKSKLVSGKMNVLSFHFFWPNFDEGSNYFTACLEGTDISEPIQIHSVFRSRLSKIISVALAKLKTKLRVGQTRKVRRIWFTGENLRPPLDDSYDATISFDQDDFRGSNTYFPLLYLETLFPNPESDSRRGVTIDPSTLLLERSLEGTDKQFTCAFINNPHTLRLRALQELSRHGEVEVFGKLTDRVVKSKYETSKKFMFSLCFENSLYPGYVTEKLLDAYVCGTVPLYWGDLGREEYLNRDAFINARDFSSLSSFADYVANLSPSEYKQIYSQPLFKRIPSKDPLIEALLGKKLH